MYLAGTSQIHWIYFTYPLTHFGAGEPQGHNVEIKYFGLELCKVDTQDLKSKQQICILHCKCSHKLDNLITSQPGPAETHRNCFWLWT